MSTWRRESWISAVCTKATQAHLFDWFCLEFKASVDKFSQMSMAVITTSSIGTLASTFAIYRWASLHSCYCQLCNKCSRQTQLKGCVSTYEHLYMLKGLDGRGIIDKHIILVFFKKLSYVPHKMLKTKERTLIQPNLESNLFSKYAHIWIILLFIFINIYLFINRGIKNIS